MPHRGHHHALSPRRERATLLTLGALQFTHILDFMIIMPLGAQLMSVFAISPAQFAHLVAAYGLSAAVSGLAGGFVLDRFGFPVVGISLAALLLVALIPVLRLRESTPGVYS